MTSGGHSSQVHAARSPGGSHEILVEALQDLYRAIHKTSIYPQGHPEVDAAISQALPNLTDFLAARPTVVIGIAPDHFLLDRERIHTDTAILEPLARLLHGLDVVALELRSGLTARELNRFAFRVSQARREGPDRTDLNEALAGEGLEHIRIAFIDYRGLSFVEGAGGSRGDDTDAEEVWDRLVATLTDSATYQTGLSGEDLAGAVQRQIETSEGEGVGRLRQRMHALTRRLEGMSETDREALRARLANFVGALSSDLRRDLLRVDRQVNDGSLDLVTQIAADLPDPVLLDVLRNVDIQGGRVPTQFMTLLNKLVRISSDQSGQSKGLHDVLGRWGVPQQLLGGDPAGLQTALEEVFRRRQEVDCNPTAYQGLLDHLSTHEIEPVTRAVYSRYHDPRNPAEVQGQVAKIALRLLEEEQEEEGRAGLLGFLGAATDSLIESGQYHPVRDAAVTARSLCTREGVGETSRLAAAGFLRDLTAEQRIDRILEGVCRGETLPRAAAALLALGGATALGRILDYLSIGLSPEVTEELTQLAVRMGRPAMAELLQARAEQDWTRIESAFPVIRRLPGRDAVALLENLAGYSDPRLRTEALRGLYDLDRQPGSPERHLSQALGDTSPRVVMAAVQMLFSLGRPEAIEVLGTFLEGSIPRAEPGLALSRRVAQGLLALGETGRQRLCQALDALRRSVRPRHVRTGDAVCKVLAAHRHEVPVARALSRWRFSPAGLLSLVAFRQRGAGMEGVE